MSPLFRGAFGVDAFFRLLDTTPAGGMDTRQVTRHPVMGEPITAFGFPVGLDGGTLAAGKVLIEDGWGWLQVVGDDDGKGRFLEPGFSGAAAMAMRGDRPRLIGMVSQVDHRNTRLGILIPSEVLCRA